MNLINRSQDWGKRRQMALDGGWDEACSDGITVAGKGVCRNGSSHNEQGSRVVRAATISAEMGDKKRQRSDCSKRQTALAGGGRQACK